MSVLSYSSTPASNTNISGINIAENCAAANINNAIRLLMADVLTARASTATVTGAATSTINTDAPFVTVTGSVIISSLGNGAAVGQWNILYFSGSPILTHNATSLILPGGADIVGSTGDTAIFVYLGSGNWRCVSYMRAVTPPQGSIVVLEDQKSSGTAGGTATPTTWTNRTLNTEVVDSAGICTLSANQFTLPAGTYKIYAVSMFSGVTRAKLRLRNITDGTTTLVGASDGNVASAEVSGRFSLTASKTLAIQYYVAATASTSDLGAASVSGEVEVYTRVIIERTA